MKPILFNTEMVQAILEGRKTVTRRICKDLGNYDFKWGLDRKPYIGDYRVFEKIGPRQWGWVTLKNQWLYDLQTAVDDSKTYLLMPPYKVGDILYVRETFNDEETDTVLYAADKEFTDFGCKKVDGYLFMESEIKWKPSIHMPKKLARIFLKVTDVRVERLQDITEEQAIKEGVKDPYNYADSSYFDNKHFNNLQINQSAFVALWNSTIKKQDLDEYGWESNPFVWVIEFERVKEVWE